MEVRQWFKNRHGSSIKSYHEAGLSWWVAGLCWGLWLVGAERMWSRVLVWEMERKHGTTRQMLDRALRELSQEV